FAELTAGLPRRQLNLLVQLRTNHIPLQFYLARISKADVATCPTCGGVPETVAHFLLSCPTYTLHRAVHYRPLGFSGLNLKTLLNSKDALRPLFDYVNATGRLRVVFGALELPDDDGDG
ncbi:hypothetical protein GY45DRAFT_1208738, partial [Cubamyces sp. BRFM 1775]